MRVALLVGVAVSGVLLAGCGGSTPGAARGLGDTASPASSSSAAAEPTEQAASTPDSEPSVQPSASDAAPLQANKVAGANGGASCPYWNDFVAQANRIGAAALTCGDDDWFGQRYHYLARASGSLVLLTRGSGDSRYFYLESSRPCSDRYGVGRAFRDLPWMQGYC